MTGAVFALIVLPLLIIALSVFVYKISGKADRNIPGD